MAHLHVFNPQHDLVLAAGTGHFTPPAAAVRLAEGLAFIPAFWASHGDAVLVPHRDAICDQMARFQPWMADVTWLEPQELRGWVKHLSSKSLRLHPWGWDAALCLNLKRAGVPADVLPSDGQLAAIRGLSARHTAVQLLSDIRRDLHEVEGASAVVHDIGQIGGFIEEWGSIVLKSPWSCSGRGVRFVCDCPPAAFAQSPVAAWAQNVLRAQGAIAVERLLPKTLDFGMEFYANADGSVTYAGLSVFTAAHGAYSGNVVATEEEKMQMVGAYVPAGLLAQVRQWLCHRLPTVIDGAYTGPLGIDMMVVPTPRGYTVNPCVEINLRRTMGHLALALCRRGMASGRFFIDNYQLHINQ